MSRILVVSLAMRTFQNVRPVLDLLRKENWEIDVVWTPSRAQPDLQSPADLGFRLCLETDWREQPADANYAKLAPDHEFWKRFTEVVEKTQPQVVICDDATNWPSIGASHALSRLARRPPLVAFQHGLSQPWHALNRTFHFDFFMSFGMQHVFMFDAERWPRVLPTGLPKLDHLRDVATEDEGYLLYVAQHFPSADAVGRMLDELRAAGTFGDIRIRPHPGHPQVYDSLRDRFRLLDPATDPIEDMRRATAIVMPHSTALLEALLLRKPVVVLPSSGLTDFPLLPWAARDVSASEIRQGLVQANSVRRREDYERFLDRICGGQRFASAALTADTLRWLATAQSRRVSDYATALWESAEGTALLAAMRHPGMVSIPAAAPKG